METALLSLLAPASPDQNSAEANTKSTHVDQAFGKHMRQAIQADAAPASKAVTQQDTGSVPTLVVSSDISLPKQSSDIASLVTPEIQAVIPDAQMPTDVIALDIPALEVADVTQQATHYPSVFPVDSESLAESMYALLARIAGVEDDATQVDPQQLDVMQLAEAFNPTLAYSLDQVVNEWSSATDMTHVSVMQVTKVNVAVSIMIPGASEEFAIPQDVDATMLPEFLAALPEATTIVYYAQTQTITSVSISTTGAIQGDATALQLPQIAMSLADALDAADDEPSSMLALIERLVTTDDSKVQRSQYDVSERVLDITTEEGFDLAQSLMAIADFAPAMQKTVLQIADMRSGFPLSEGVIDFVPAISGELMEEDLTAAESLMVMYTQAPWQEQRPVMVQWQSQVITVVKEVTPALNGGASPMAELNAMLKHALAGADNDTMPKASASAEIPSIASQDTAEFDELVQRVLSGEAKPSSHFVADAFARHISSQPKQGFMLEQLKSGLHEATNDLASGTAKESVSQGLQATSLQTTHFNSPSDRSISFLKADNPLLNSGGSAAEQVSLTISRAVNAGTDRVVVQLDPADLGRVEIRLDVHADGRTVAVINADNKDTLDQLQRDAKLLEKALQDAGLDASEQDMAFNLQGDDSQGDDSQQDGMKTAAQEDETQEQVPVELLSENYTLSINDGLDIKV